MRAACSYVKKCKAIRAPKCGCKVCEDKWAAKQFADHLRKSEETVSHWPTWKQNALGLIH